MKVSNLKRFINRIDNIQENKEKEIEDYLKTITKKALRKVKLKTPVRDGLLRRSWRMEKESALKYSVLNNVEYAIHVEYGHRTRQGIKTGITGKIRYVKGARMLSDTITEIRKDMKKEGKEVLIKILK